MPDEIHPNNEGYRLMGNWWYSFITQIPAGWVPDAEGSDPARTPLIPPGDLNDGPDQNIPAPLNVGNSPITPTDIGAVRDAYNRGQRGGRLDCKVGPTWEYTGKVALGAARSGDSVWHTEWNQLGKIVQGIGRDGRYVR